MKKFLAIMLMLLPMIAWGQKITKHEIDKFIKKTVIETSHEKIASFNKWKSLKADNTAVFASIRYVDGEWIMPATIQLDDIEKFTEGDGITLLLADGTVIILETLYSGIGAREKALGSRLYHFDTAFRLTAEEVEQLRTNSVTDVRISYLGNHKDLKVDKKKGEKLMKMIKLIDDALAK